MNLEKIDVMMNKLYDEFMKHGIKAGGAVGTGDTITLIFTICTDMAFTINMYEDEDYYELFLDTEEGTTYYTTRKTAKGAVNYTRKITQSFAWLGQEYRIKEKGF